MSHLRPLKFVLAAIVAILMSSLGALAATSFYVDPGRTGNGTGTSGSPWKLWSDINWTTVASAIVSGDVYIYFSSRASQNIGSVYVPGSGAATGTLHLVGDEIYNALPDGTAVWQAESAGNRSQLNGGSIDIQNNGTAYVSIKGFYVNHPTWGCINIGTSNPTLNIHHISIINNFLDSPANNHGVWFGFAETGCHDVLVSGNMIKNTPLESIYMGHYSFLGSSIKGIVVENNTIIDCGKSGQGDGPDIKPACYGAIVRGNTHYRTSPSVTGGACGTVVGADHCEIYGNRYFAMAPDGGGDWGYGIFLNADGDALGNGQGITSCLIYNNLIYNNRGPAGIRVLCSTAGTPTANISGVKLWNNTIAGNISGLELRSSNGRTITVAEMKNNIFASNSGPSVLSNSGGETITSADRNLYYQPPGTLITYRGVNKSFAQWQALGFDVNGVNADPLFMDSTSGNFHLQSSSPGRNAGADLSGNFTTDFEGKARTIPWDIGAYVGGPSPASLLRVLAP